MIQERVVASLRKAKTSGKHVCRPRALLNRLRIEQLRAEGLSWREVARRMGLPASTVYKYRGLSTNLEHPSQRVPFSHWSALRGHALSWLLLPLAPERYAPAITPRPFLMVNGSGDSLVPGASALALYDAARPPKELIWVATEHVRPSEANSCANSRGL